MVKAVLEQSLEISRASRTRCSLRYRIGLGPPPRSKALCALKHCLKMLKPRGVLEI